jgi:hypothetical protein
MEGTMANRILRTSTLWLIALVFSIPALASRNGITTSKDKRLTFASPSVRSADDPGLGPDLSAATIIYNNISRVETGRYNCCQGWTISGPDSPVGQTFADAMPFTPAVNDTVTKVLVAVGFVTGTNGVTVSVNEDAGGLPGNVLQSFELTALETFGSCCLFETSIANIPVTAGTQYWVVVATSDETSDTWNAWNQNVTDQTQQPFAFFNNGVWQPTSGILGAFAVLGIPTAKD